MKAKQRKKKDEVVLKLSKNEAMALMEVCGCLTSETVHKIIREAGQCGVKPHFADHVVYKTYDVLSDELIPEEFE